jgi:alcohol dehydrogenase (cytochrome c)
LDARSAEDGSQIWHFWSIPGPGEPGHETWPDTDIYLEGASSFWVTGTYDPDTNLLYYGVSNPTPFGDPTLRPGDNLYSQSTVALDGDTGSLQWYFQYTPNDQWDYDEIGTQMLVNADGQERILHFGRNGFLYTLDAATGEFLTALQYVNVLNWTQGIDEKTGKPVEYDPNLGNTAPQTYAIAPLGGFGDNGDLEVAPMTCPNAQGGVNFQPTAYSPLTNYTYGSSLEGCSGDEAPAMSTGAMVAATPDGAIAEKVAIPFVPYGGTLATGGHLVFSSMVNGDFFAVDDQTLETLWSVNLGSPIEAPPMTYAVNGQQYVVIPVGTAGINNFFPGGGYMAHGDDPNAALLANQQRTWTLYFFSL